MAIDLSYFRAIQNATNMATIQDVIAGEAKAQLDAEMPTSIQYQSTTMRNGTTQSFIVTRGERNDECFIIAMPDEVVNVGDIIDCYGQKWIVIEVSPVNTLQYRGKMKLCNHLFRFQNFTSTIYERWGVLDPGVYSTTTTAKELMEIPNRQYKVYLPYDDNTKLLYVDKRFATSIMYNAAGEQVLTVYRFTAFDDVCESWGSGKLLVMYAKSDAYNAATDNIETLICDYIAANSSQEGGSWV